MDFIDQKDRASEFSVKTKYLLETTKTDESMYPKPWFYFTLFEQKSQFLRFKNPK